MKLKIFLPQNHENLMYFISAPSEGSHICPRITVKIIDMEKPASALASTSFYMLRVRALYA
jgi:hypothetical protein